MILPWAADPHTRYMHPTGRTVRVIPAIDFGTGVSAAAAGGMALTALGMVLTPGPNMVYLVSRSVSQGPVAGMISLAGTCVGFLVYMTMANLPTVQGFSLGAIQVAVSLLVNALIVLGAGSIAAFLSGRPNWTKWQRRVTGSALGLVAVLLAPEVPVKAHI